MTLDIREEAPTITNLTQLLSIPIAFRVDKVLEVRLLDGGLVGMSLVEVPVADPYVKDYDAGEGTGAAWSERFDISNWRLICAHRNGVSVGGAVIAAKTPGLHMLDGRDDVAVLWDMRVSPQLRREGIGSALFEAVAEWARAHGFGWLKIETQNVNLPACRFYQKMGCTLGALDRFAYPAEPREVQVVWWKELAPGPGNG